VLKPDITQGCANKEAPMNINVQAVKFTLDDERKTFVEKKLERIKYADDLITDVLLNIKLDKKLFSFDCTVNFRWGGNGHVSAEDFDFNAGMNKLMDVLDQKVKKEKDKVQEKK
jgi:putative sigma-54 modulation protein